ncbi:unnamed protein product [Heterobilharzia americana]|nr:unnamed protein product [Heterobilharzia americana]
MHNGRRNFRPDPEATMADTIRVVACKQNQDLQITFANDYACSDRPRSGGSKMAYSTSGPTLREPNCHRKQHQSVNVVHRGARPNKNYGNDGFSMSHTIDSHIPNSYGSASKRLLNTKSDLDHQSSRHSAHGMHFTHYQQDQYNRDLMTQYEIDRALFLANPPPSVLASRNRENRLNDNRRVDVKNPSIKQTVYNGSRADHAVVNRTPLDHQRMDSSFRRSFLSKSTKERTPYNLEYENDGSERFSNSYRGFMRPFRSQFQNGFHRGRGSRQHWGHDDRFENYHHNIGVRGQNSPHNGDTKTRQYSGDEYIDDLTPEDIAKYKLEINMDNFIVDRPILSDPILSVPLSKWQSDDLLLLFSASSKVSSNRHRFIDEFQKQQHCAHNQQYHHHYHNNRNQYRNQNQRNHPNFHHTPLQSSRREPIRSNQRIHGSNSSSYNHSNYKASKQHLAKQKNHSGNLKMSKENSTDDNNNSSENQVNDDFSRCDEAIENSTYYEQDINCGVFDINCHERARSFLTLGIYDNEISQNDGYTYSTSEISMHGLYRCHSLPSLRNSEKNYQPLSFEDCTTPTTSVNANGVTHLSTKMSQINVIEETPDVKFENSDSLSADNCNNIAAEEAMKLKDTQ